MAATAKEFARKVLPQRAFAQLRRINIARNALSAIAPRHCNICGYHGHFYGFGRPMRLDAHCPDCESLERHRLMMLALTRGDIPQYDDPDINVLHFAPEAIFETIFRKHFKHYRTADLFEAADLKLDLEDIDLPDGSVDMIIANHVLEHVDDRKTAKELSRILSKDGILICQVPLIEGWDATYEDAAITSQDGRRLHFGQEDHLRYYGRDFRTRIAQGGFDLPREITSQAEDVVKYGLNRGEKVFVFTKKS